MSKLGLCVAVLAAAVSTSAVAKDRKAPAVPAAQMSDSEMDRVTAGDAGGNSLTRWGHSCTPAWQCNGSSPNGKALGRQL
jgi:hypothetical protein